MIDALAAFFENTAFLHLTFGNILMFIIAGLLIYIAIEKDAEPLLLIPIAFGIILANIPPDITGILNPPTNDSPGGLLQDSLVFLLDKLLLSE